MFSGKYGKIIAPPGRVLRPRIRSLPDGLPRFNYFPYFLESMNYYYRTVCFTV